MERRKGGCITVTDERMVNFIRGQRLQLEKLLEENKNKYSEERLETLKSEINGLKIREARYKGDEK